MSSLAIETVAQLAGVPGFYGRPARRVRSAVKAHGEDEVLDRIRAIGPGRGFEEYAAAAESGWRPPEVQMPAASWSGGRGPVPRPTQDRSLHKVIQL